MTQSPSLTSWRAVAVLFGALFLMSGVDGQQRVQAVFLLLACACLAVDALLPAVRVWWRSTAPAPIRSEVSSARH